VAKLLLVVAVFTVVYLVLRSYGRKMERRTPPPQEGAAREAGSRHGEDMVRCRVCGVHLPRSEALTSRGEMFCSREHLQLSRNGD
jgi:uncharacterized protein